MEGLSNWLTRSKATRPAISAAHQPAE